VLLLQAAEMASDLTSRRRSTLAAMLGRTRITPEQQDMLLGGSPASRICDLLLTLGSSEERLGLLPDCFTPPDDAGVAHADVTHADVSSSSSIGGEAAGEEETEELWCTPMQLLNEIEARLKAAAAAADGQAESNSSSSRTALGAGSSSSSLESVAEQQQQRQLPAGEPVSAAAAAAGSQAGPDSPAAAESAGLTGQAALAALQELRGHIMSSWLESLPQAIGSSSSSIG
jgi:hypothetical protein